MIDLNQKLIEIIKERTPSGVNPVDVLIEIIPIKKEGAYRRLRGEIQFSLTEAAAIATRLMISLDEILDNKEDSKYMTHIIRMNGRDPFKAYCTTIQETVDAMKYIKNYSEASLCSATNLFPYSHIFGYEALSKLRLFKFMHQCRKDTNSMKMSEFTVPADVREVEKIYNVEIKQVPITYIWSKDMFSVFVADVKYFFEINLLSKSEVDLLIKEANELLNELERDIISGKMSSGCPFNIYLSNTFFDSNYISLESPVLRAATINVFGINFYTSTEFELCDNMKDWIDSLMKYSVLISESGVVERTAFFKQQRSLFDTIHQDC